jgi:hypothetical protein
MRALWPLGRVLVSTTAISNPQGSSSLVGEIEKAEAVEQG